MELPPLTVVQPGEGRAGELGAIGVVFKLWGKDTNGAMAIVEHPFAVGALVTPHLHTREDEYSIVTEAGPPSVDAVVALTQSYGLEFAEPEWLPDVVARYNLNA